MDSKRSYGDACRFAHALDLVGERWTLLIIRELLLGPKRFTDIREGLPHASPTIISDRLRGLEQAGIVRRTKLAPPAASKVYELTDWGLELEPIVTRLGAWGARSPVAPTDTSISGDSIVLALRSLFDPDAAKGLKASYELRFGEEIFHVEVAGSRLEVGRGAAHQPDVVVETEAPTLAGLLSKQAKLDDIQRSGAMRIEGDRRLVSRFTDLFPMPEPAAVA